MLDPQNLIADNEPEDKGSLIPGGGIPPGDNIISSIVNENPQDNATTNNESEFSFVPDDEKPIEEIAAQEAQQLEFVPKELPPDKVPIPYSYDDNRFLAQQAALAQSTIDPETGLTDFDKLVDSYNFRILQGQEHLIRREISRQVAERESASVMQLTREAFDLGERDPNLLLDSVRLAAQLRQEENVYALEQRAVDQLADFAARNPDWAKLQLEQPTIMDNVYDDLEKELIIQNEISRWRALDENQDGWASNIFKDAPEVLGTLGIQPILSKYGAAGGFRIGALMRERGERIRNLPKEQIPFALQELVKEYEEASSWFRDKNPDAVEEYLQNTFNATDESANSATTGFIADTVITVAGLGLVKGAKKLSKAAYALGKTGNTSKIADDALKILETRNISNSSSLNNVDEAIKNVIGFRLPDEVMMGVSGKVRDQLIKQEMLASKIKGTYNVDRLTPDELASAVAKESKFIDETYKEGSALDISYHYNTDKNLYEIHFNLGNEAGNPYTSKEIAEEAMYARGISGEVFQHEDGGWYIRGIKEIQEEGEILGIPDLVDMPTGMIKRTLQDQRSIVSKFIGAQGTASVQNDARLSGVVSTLYRNSIGKLGPKEFKNFSEIADEGLKAEKWFNPDELDSMLLSRGYEKGTKSYDKIVTAYYSARQISDSSYFLSNRDLYTNAARRGLREIELFDNPINEGVSGNSRSSPFNGKEIKDLSRFKGSWERQIIYDLEKREFVKGSKEYIKEALENGKTVISPEDATFTKDIFGSPATLIVGPKKSIQVRNLRYQQLGYVPGGRRIYEDTFFVGQTRKGSWPEELGGGSYALRPKTLFTAQTRLQAERFTESLGRAIKNLKDFEGNIISRDVANNAIKESMSEFKSWGIRNIDDLKKFIDERDIDIEVPIHVRGNREAPPISEEETALFSTDDGFDFHASIGNRFNTGRGSQLHDITGKPADTLNFNDALRRSVDTAVKSSAYNDVRISAMERFAKEFGNKNTMIYNDNASPYEIVTKGTIRKDLIKTNPKLYERAKSMQFYINSLLKTESTWDMKVASATMRFANWVEGTNAPLASTIARKFTKQGKIDPTATLRSFNFNFSLGMFNPRQLLLQAQSITNSVSIDPIRGLGAFKSLPFFRYALYQSEKSFDLEMATRGWRLAGFKSKDDMAAAIDQFRNIGANDFGSTIGQIDATNSLGMGTNWTLNKASRVNEAGKMFFNEGERWGRITAYEIARRRWVDNVGNVNPKGLHFTDKNAVDWIRDEYNRITISPNASDNPLFTRGLLSLPTQFWSYQSKLLNAMLPKIGSRNYTTAEKVRMIGGQALFYGTGAIPLFEAISDKFLRESGVELNPTTYKFLTNGLIDGMIYAASDGQLDTDLSNSASIGGFFDILTKAATESPLLELIGGAAVSNLSRGFEAGYDVAKMYSLWENPKIETIGLMGYEFLSKTIASERERTKALLAWNTGMLFDQNGGTIGRINKGETILMMFGIPPAVMNKTFGKYEDTRANSEDIKSMARILNKLHTSWKLAQTDEEKKQIEQAISLYSASVRNTGYADLISNQALQMQKRTSFEDNVNRRMLENYLRDPKSVNVNDLPPEMRQIREHIKQGLIENGSE